MPIALRVKWQYCRRSYDNRGYCLHERSVISAYDTPVENRGYNSYGSLEVELPSSQSSAQKTLLTCHLCSVLSFLVYLKIRASTSFYGTHGKLNLAPNLLFLMALSFANRVLFD